MEAIGLYALKVFTSYFAIMNPIASIPIFLGLAQDFDANARRLLARRSVWVAFLIILFFSLGGKFLFELFDLTIPAFQITGGILVFFIGFEMLQSKKSTIKSTAPEAEERRLASEAAANDIAVSPLGTPLLAGPGTIVTAMNNVTNVSVREIVVNIIIFGLICLLTYLAFVSSDRLMRLIGANVIKVVGKIMGLILGVIGSDMFIRGVKGAFEWV